MIAPKLLLPFGSLFLMFFFLSCNEQEESYAHENMSSSLTLEQSDLIIEEGDSAIFTFYLSEALPVSLPLKIERVALGVGSQLNQDDLKTDLICVTEVKDFVVPQFPAEVLFPKNTHHFSIHVNTQDNTLTESLESLQIKVSPKVVNGLDLNHRTLYCMLWIVDND